MNDKDKQGRPWAKLSQLRDGDRVELDGGFICIDAGIVQIMSRPSGLAFRCAHGHHYLSGQADDGEHLVGVYSVPALA